MYFSRFTIKLFFLLLTKIVIINKTLTIYIYEKLEAKIGTDAPINQVE